MFRQLVNRTAIHGIIPKQYKQQVRSLITFTTDGSSNSSGSDNKSNDKSKDDFKSSFVSSLITSSMVVVGLAFYDNRQKHWSHFSPVRGQTLHNLSYNEMHIFEEMDESYKKITSQIDRIDSKIQNKIDRLEKNLKEKSEAKTVVVIPDVKPAVKPSPVKPEVKYDVDVCDRLIDEYHQKWITLMKTREEEIRWRSTDFDQRYPDYKNNLLKEEQNLKDIYDLIVKNDDFNGIKDIIDKMKLNLVTLKKQHFKNEQIRSNSDMTNEYLDNTIKMYESRINTEEKIINQLENRIGYMKLATVINKTVLVGTMVGIACVLGNYMSR